MMPRLALLGTYVSLWAALTLAAAARAFVLDGAALGLLVTMFWALVQGAGLWYAHNRRGSAPKKLEEGLAAFGLVAFLVEVFVGGLVQALMSLLLWLQAARNPGLSARRGVYFALAISLTLIAFGASEAKSSAFVFLLTAYGIATLICLIYCHQEEEPEVGPPEPAWPPRAAKLALSMGHLAVFCGAVLTVALLGYLLIPRPAPVHYGIVAHAGGDKYHSPKWEREAKGETAEAPGKPGRESDRSVGDGESGFSPENSFDITRSGQDAATLDAIVLYLQADRTLYLRERSYDRFSDDRWVQTRERSRKLLPQDGKFRLAAVAQRPSAAYVARVAQRLGNHVPLPAGTTELVAPVRVIALGEDAGVALPANLERGFVYRGTAMLPKVGERALSRDPLSDRARYLQLPDAFSPRIRQLAADAMRQGATPLAKAEALEAHLRREYAYSFETVLSSQGVTPLESFLFETRRGHCEFFASAMAAMLRAEGIPSRLVHGYLAHAFNPVTGFYEVRGFDRHARVEAHIDGLGWLTFEPTAAYPAPTRGGHDGTPLVDLGNYVQKLEQLDIRKGRTGLAHSLAVVFGKLSEWWQGLLFALESGAIALQAWVSSHAFELVLMLTLAGGGAALGYQFRTALLWFLAKLALRLAPEDEMPVRALHQLERVARTRTCGRESSETIDEYCQRLLRHHPRLGEELGQLRRGFNAVRYGRKRPSADQNQRIRQAFQLVGESLLRP